MKSKILAMLIAVLLSPILSIGQTISLNSTSDVEVGISKTIIATGAVPAGFSITGYEWEYSGINLGQSGQSGIEDKINGSTDTQVYPSPFIRNTSASDTISIIWGDFNNGDLFTYVSVRMLYTDTAGVSKTSGWADYQADIKRVQTPGITGPSSIYECCPEKVVYVDLSNGTQDNWDWQVVGGTLQSGQGTNAIQFIPYSTGLITISATARRNSSLTSYSRSKTITISHPSPPPISIVGSNIVCIDDVLHLTLGGYCGTIINVVWDFPKNIFELVDQSLEEDPFIELRPLDGVKTGEEILITGTATLDGGCDVELIPIGVTIFNTDPPPCPTANNLSLVLPPNFDPCNPSGAFTILYTDTNFINGVSFWTPQVIAIVPHHNLGESVVVTVCNTNICAPEGEDECCKDFTLYFPPPCNAPNQGGGTSTQSSINEYTISSDANSLTNISVYPNPATNIIHYKSDIALNGELSVFDKDGNKVLEQGLNNTLEGNIDISGLNITGFIYIYFQNGNSFQSKKVLIK